MAYIGNAPEINAFTIGVERFSGTGACTEFTLTRDIDDAKAVEVVISGSQKDPDNDYTVTNGLVTFTVAPTAGTDNIVITYRAPVVVTFNQVSQSQILAGAVGTTQLAASSVTTDKIAAGAVQTVDIAVGAITGNLLSVTSVGSNNIVLGAITGNLIADNAVSGNNIVSPPDIFDDAFLFGGM